MTTPQQALEGARWICEQLPDAIEVVYSTDSEKWYIRLQGALGELSPFVKSAVTLRSVEELRHRIGMAGRTTASRAKMLGMANLYVVFTREFVQHPKASDWMAGAAWAVTQAMDIKYVGPDENCFRWTLRTANGCVTLSSTIEFKDLDNLKSYLNDTPNRDPDPEVHMWVNREFLEEWAVCAGSQVPVKKVPEVPVQVMATITTESKLPPDLQVAEKFKGLTVAERRQGHVNAILEDMMTRRASPRYK